MAIGQVLGAVGDCAQFFVSLQGFTPEIVYKLCTRRVFGRA